MKVKNLNTVIEDFSNPEVLGLSYGVGGELVINYTPNSKQIVDIKFKDVIGFRLLDEGDLLTYWNFKELTSNWIVEIIEGGWMDLEKSTGGFLSKDQTKCKEYFVMSDNDCVSVLAFEEPIIEVVLQRY